MTTIVKKTEHDMKTKKLYIFAAILSISFLIILIISSASLYYKSKNVPKGNTDTETEYVYIYADTETSFPTTTEEKDVWLVREYNERIGIFAGDGTLVQIIETHTKTLPVAERELLREGFEVSSEKELYSIIENYTD